MRTTFKLVGVLYKPDLTAFKKFVTFNISFRDQVDCIHNKRKVLHEKIAGHLYKSNSQYYVKEEHTSYRAINSAQNREISRVCSHLAFKRKKALVQNNEKKILKLKTNKYQLNYFLMSLLK